MASLTSQITQNVPAGTQQVIFSNPSQIDSITYSSNQITLPIASSYVLSETDFGLFYTYSLQFRTTLLQNFPSINQSVSAEIPVCLFEIQSLGGPNLLNFVQTSTASPITLVYNITFDRGAKTATFAARNNSINITLQEYLLAFQILTLYAQQVALN